MTVAELLKSKGNEVVTAAPGDDVQSALDRMLDHRVGSLLVLEKEQVVGIVTERDILRRGLHRPVELGGMSVKEIMTSEVMVTTPEDSLQYVMGVMTRNRIRHVPVFEAEKLVGLVSIGDIVFTLLEESSKENRYLRDFIRGTY